MASLSYIVDSADDECDARLAIIPALTCANLPQLIVDLLIASFDIEQAKGRLHFQHTLPFVSASSSGNSLFTATQLFETAELKDNVALVQRRVPTVLGYTKQFACEITDFLAKRYGCVLLLTSADSAMRNDPHGAPMMAAATTTAFGDDLCTKQWRWSDAGVAVRSGLDDEMADFLPENGFTRRAFEHAEANGIRLIVLLSFVAEGDNRPDAATAVQRLQALGAVKLPGEIKAPREWAHVGFSAIPSTLY